MNMQQLAQTALAVATQLGLKIVGALALWFVGRWLIQFTVRLVHRALERESIDTTLSQYLETALSVLLTIALIISMLGFFGVQTTTFAALVAAAGVAIGVAWSGLLANFAAGAFLVVLRPFKVGFDTNRMIREAFVEAGFRAPVPEFAVRGQVPGVITPAATG